MAGKKLISILIFCIIWLTGVSQKPQRIVSLAPSITKNIYLLEAQDKLVGCTSYCTEGVAGKKEIVASAVNVNIEKVFSLQPDLVLTMLLTKPQDIETLKKLGIRVVVMPTPKDFEGICSQFIKIGEIVGKKDFAINLIKAEQAKVEQLQAAVSKENKKQKVFFQIGAKPIFTVLPNTFMDDYIQLSGCVNIATDLKRGTITREAVLLRNPDVIIIATMGRFGEEEKENWLSYEGLSAARNKKVFLIESDNACSPTPDNFTKSLTQVFKFIYE